MKVCLRKCSYKKWPKSFSGKFGEIRAKILCTPKNLPAPTPVPLLTSQTVITQSCYGTIYKITCHLFIYAAPDATRKH